MKYADRIIVGPGSNRANSAKSRFLQERHGLAIRANPAISFDRSWFANALKDKGAVEVGGPEDAVLANLESARFRQAIDAQAVLRLVDLGKQSAL